MLAYISRLHCYGSSLQMPDDILMRNNEVLMAGDATPACLQRRCCTSAKHNIMPPRSARPRC